MLSPGFPKGSRYQPINLTTEPPTVAQEISSILVIIPKDGRLYEANYIK